MPLSPEDLPSDPPYRLCICGSYRRGAPWGDLDVVTDSADLVRDLQARGLITRGPFASQHATVYGGVGFDVFVVSGDIFSGAVRYFTGSVAENRRLESIAAARGLRLTIRGLEDAEGNVLCSDERDVYEHLEEVYKEPGAR